MKPLMLINFKTYNQGKKVLKLAKKIEKIDKNIIIAVQATDISELKKQTKLKIFSEHVDFFKPGRNTGFIIPEAIKESGATGSCLNHSEHPLDLKTIKKTIQRCKNLKLKTAVFTKDLKQAKEIEKLKPNYLIYEPPELVAGKKSVSEEKPEIIKKFSKNIKIPFLVGAGIKTKKDVETSLKLGAKGIAVSSAITKSKNPEKKLKELLQK